MNHRNYFITAMLALAGSHSAWAGPSTQPSVTDEIRAVRTRIDELETAQRQANLQRQDAERKLQERETANALAADAIRHDQFLTAEGMTAGYSEGHFFIGSSDGNFLFRPQLEIQFRDTTLDRKNFVVLNKKQNDTKDEIDNGFTVRRLKFIFDGNVFSKDITYYFSFNTQRTSANATVRNSTGATVGTVSNSAGGVPQLDQANVKFHLPDSPFYLKAGQLKDPVYHEQIVNVHSQQAIERSISADIFVNGDAYTEAATFIIDPKTFWRTEAGVNHGMRGANTNFLDYPNNGSYNAYDYGIVGRAEVKAFGRWQDYDQMGAFGTKEPLLVFGTGADYSERGRDGQVVATADAMYASPSGLSLFGGFLDRYTTHNFGIYTQGVGGANITAPPAAIAGKATNEYGIVGQVGYLIDTHLEPFGRYEYFHTQGTPTGSKDWYQAITAGVNYYFHGHNVKLSGEAIYLPQGLPIDDNGSDVLASPGGKGEFSFVAQLQLWL